jgi:hypothetical protein
MPPWLEAVAARWGRMEVADWLKGGSILGLMLAVTLGNFLFNGFIDSKPEGRKTVIGEVSGYFSTVNNC